MKTHFFLAGLVCCATLLSGYGLQHRHGLPVITTDKGDIIPMMTVLPDTRAAESNTGSFQICSEVGNDAWRSHTKPNIRPPYTIETTMKLDKALPYGGLTFRIPTTDGYVGTGLSFRDTLQLRIDRSFKPLSTKLGEWTPVKITVERKSITIQSGDITLFKPLTGKVITGHIGISAWRAGGAWKAITIADKQRIRFNELWDGNTNGKWMWSNGRKLLEFSLKSGIRVFQVNLDVSGHFPCDTHVDIRHFDARCEHILKLAPDALIIARIWLDTPKGKTFSVDSKGNPQRPSPWSYSDPSELNAQKTFIRRFLGRLKRQSYKNSLAGIMLVSGDRGQFAYSLSPELFSDYSPAHLKRFQDYLADRYITIDALNQTWKTSHKNFSEITLPTPAQRQTTSAKAGLPDQWLQDFLAFHSDSVAERINILARLIKRHAPSPLLVGVSYGQIALPDNAVFNQGHNALERVLNGPVDFISTTYQSQNRTAGNPALFRLPTLSAQLHGKAVFLEDDTHTYFADAPKDTMREKDAADSIASLKRNILLALSSNAGLWYVDFCNNWFSHSHFMTAPKTGARLMEQQLKGELQSVRPEIAVLVSAKAFDRMKRTTNAVSTIAQQQTDVLARCGAPYQVALLSDLERLPDFKAYVVLNLANAPDDEKAMVENLRKKVGKRLMTPMDGQVIALPEMKHLLAQAQVTMVSDSPIAVYQGKNWLGIHTVQDDENLILTFPASAKNVTERFTNKSVTLNQSHQLILTVKKGQTFLWSWENK